MKVTNIGRPRPVLGLETLIAGGGGNPGEVPTATGSNGGIVFGPNVAVITVNGTTTVLGPRVNFANGSNTTVTVDQFPGSTASNTIRIHATGGGGSLTVEEDGGTPTVSPVDHLVFEATGDATVDVTDDTGGQVTVTIGATGGAGGGGIVLLEQHTASASATLDFTSFISSTYDEYMIDLVDILPATNATDLYMRVGTGGGPTYDTGNNYVYMFQGRNTATATVARNGTTSGVILAASVSNNVAFGPVSGSFRATALQSTSHPKQFHGTNVYATSAPNVLAEHGGGQWFTTGTAVTALRFLMSSGNITSGTIRIYGVEK